MIPQFPVYLFDIDGTLLDSAEDICGAIQRVLEEARRLGFLGPGPVSGHVDHAGGFAEVIEAL